MPTEIYSSSLVTQRRRNYALYTWNRLNNEAVAEGRSVLREQPNEQRQTIVTQRHEVRANTNPTSECPCSESVDKNAGGNMANNVQ
jgi:hypothetical protein